MRTRRSKRNDYRSAAKSQIHAPVEEDELLRDTGHPRKSSMKDAGVILTLSTIISISLVTGVFGFDKIVERVQQNEATELLLATLLFICIFSLVSLLVIKMAIHCIVYLGIATFCGILFPVSPKKQKKAINHIYANAK